MSKINVIGLGYIGLPTALSLASNGLEVVGTDYNQTIIDSLNAKKITFEEKGLEELFNDALENDIVFTKDYIKTDTYIISVPTPYKKEEKKIDPTYVVNAVNSVLDVCEKGTIIIIESTVSPGTIDKYIKPLITQRGYLLGDDIHLVHAPERILPGNMIYELKHNSRTIGADSKEIGEKVKKIYESFCDAEIVLTDIKTAEMVKVVENTFRDVNIAFANELAKICRADNMDVYEIIRIANKHPRVNILQPGPGVGGHCISVDPWFLVGDYPEQTKIISTARSINDSMPEYVSDRILTIMKEKGISDISRVGIYGLTYKEDVDDVRESPALQLFESFKKQMVSGVKAYDPYIINDIVENQYHDFESFINDIDILVILVGHKQIKENYEKVKTKTIFDTRRIYNEPIPYYL